jgi:hypothetical protein
MRSYQSFTPGRNNNSNKITNYNKYLQETCNCFQDTYKQLKTAENDPNSVSNALRISNLIKNNIGGKVSFGNIGGSVSVENIGGSVRFENFYLLNRCSPLIDSLGSIEGQPGGSFRPLRNRF